MKRSRFSEEQVIAILKEAEAEPVKTVCARHNVSQGTYYHSGKLEVAQQIANHESPRTTKLYDRRHDEISLDEIERITI
jgi:hypothetical protein